jgi:hypothetical protein
MPALAFADGPIDIFEHLDQYSVIDMEMMKDDVVALRGPYETFTSRMSTTGFP